MLSTIARALFSLAQRVVAAAATSAARRTANLAPTAQLLSTGRVINIGNRVGAINVGANSHIGGHLLTFAHGGRITIGEWCFIGAGSRIWSAAGIAIGDRVLVSHGVNIHDNDSHPLDPVARFEQTRAIFTIGHPAEIASVRAAPVRIGDDAWIGFGATILKGVTIGARAIVGANAIVRDDVPADGIVTANADTPRARVTGGIA